MERRLTPATLARAQESRRKAVAAEDNIEKAIVEAAENLKRTREGREPQKGDGSGERMAGDVTGGESGAGRPHTSRQWVNNQDG